MTRSTLVRFVDGVSVPCAGLLWRSSRTSVQSADGRIMFRHILPNVIGPALLQASLGLGFAITAEASLSFLGVGVQPPAPTWGSMIQTGSIFASRALAHDRTWYDDFRRSPRIQSTGRCHSGGTRSTYADLALTAHADTYYRRTSPKASPDFKNLSPEGLAILLANLRDVMTRYKERRLDQ